VNELITGGLDTVGLRIPQHPQFQQVLKESQTYLCAPSANRFKSISPTRSSDVIDELDGRIPAVLDGGPCAIGVESTVLSLSPTGEATILRYGQVSKEDLEGVINTEVKNLDSLHDASAPQTISAPGQMKTHYAPSKPFYYLDQNLTPARWSHVLDVLGSERHHGCSLGLLLTQQTNVTFNNTYPDLAACFEHIVTLCDDIPEGNNIKTEYHEALSRKSLEPDDATAAHRLFPALRALDQGPAEVLLTEPFPQRSGIAHAIHDRLMKATSHQVIHA
jgi:L-threonylcarbamoyladenylate synthase